jgi:integrase
MTEINKKVEEGLIDKMTGVPNSILDKLYNKENKKLFLKEYLEEVNTREAYAVYLLSLGNYESLIGKDLHSFSASDIINFFSTIYTSSPTSLRAYFSILKQYSAWSNSRGFNRTGTNPFSTLSFKDDILGMLNLKNIDSKFLTEEEVWELCNNVSINPQDTACLIPVFYGIKGNKCSELINLKIDDISSIHNTITLVTDMDEETREILGTRTIGVSDKLIKILKDSWGQADYNRRGKEGYGKRVTAKLYDSDYILRPTTVNGNAWITPQTCNTRIKKIFKDAELNHLSMIDVYNSGKIHALNNLEKEKGELTIDSFKYVQNMFGDSMENYANLKMMYEIYKTAISKAE